MAREIDFDKSFIENSSASRNSIKRYILRHNLLPYFCEKCKNIGFWNGEPLTLQLDHKNGINNDNRLENLRWLCPNCHSQTETFTGRNKGSKEKVSFSETEAIEALEKTSNIHQAVKLLGCSKGGANWMRIKQIKIQNSIIQQEEKTNKSFCKKCGKEIHLSSKTKLCKNCYNSSRERKVKNRPSREELKTLLRECSFLAIGKKYNVSDNAIRKWCDTYHLPRSKREITSYSNEEWELI